MRCVFKKTSFITFIVFAFTVYSEKVLDFPAPSN